ncbi:hypothetical protein COO60DRAFT_1558041, partial [Scenedesmus sp. NREL 46B-D3]
MLQHACFFVFVCVHISSGVVGDSTVNGGCLLYWPCVLSAQLPVAQAAGLFKADGNVAALYQAAVCQWFYSYMYVSLSRFLWQTRAVQEH